MASPRSPTPSPFLLSRLAACRAKIQEKHVAGYLVTSRADQYYLTGFDGEDGAALILPERVHLLTDGRFKDVVRRDAPWARAWVRMGPLAEQLGRLVRKLRLKTVGFQPAALTVAALNDFRKAVRPARLVPMPPIVRELRAIKDRSEVSAIERAIRVAEEAFGALLRRIRIGWTERRIAAELLAEMLRRGAAGPSFPIIVAEGPNSALPHARPGDRRVRAGSVLLIDWGAVVDHYRSDLTRVVFIRRIPPRFRRMYGQVLEAQEAAIRAIRPGVPMSAVDAAARRRLQKAGLARYFTHSTGHGLGLDIHEPPRVAVKIDEPLQAGMVITIEPGVYLPGVGGVRIEDDVLVTPQGGRVLTRVPKS
ncbi:MAG: aminopeptidase P family protein, partial [Phycisphaerae bacterium]